MLRHVQDDIAVARGTLLPLDEPGFETALMENMIAHRNPQQLLTLLEKLKADFALMLLLHVFLALRVVI